MVSQALTLYTTPVIYLYMDRLQLRIKGRKAARILGSQTTPHPASVK
jgi:hypothetical protein